MRKKLTYSSIFNGFPIQVFDPPGAFISILNRAFTLIHFTLGEHSQVLVNGFCATYPIDDDQYVARDLSNDTFLAFLESLRSYLWEHDFDPIIIWCREQTDQWDQFGAPHHPHWHFSILSDGNEHRWLGALKIKELWNMHLGLPSDARGHIHRTKLGGDYFAYMMRRGNYDTIARVIKALSYLAKSYDKRFTPPGVQKYDSSQLANRQKHIKKVKRL